MNMPKKKKRWHSESRSSKRYRCSFFFPTRCFNNCLPELYPTAKTLLVYLALLTEVPFLPCPGPLPSSALLVLVAKLSDGSAVEGGWWSVIYKASFSRTYCYFTVYMEGYVSEMMGSPVQL